MSASSWDARYAERGWLREPSSTVVQALTGVPPGRAVDLAAGPGRHARWLAARGWQVTAVDSSAVGIGQGRAADPSGEVEWVVADALQWSPDGQVDLVLAAYVQLGAAGLRRAAGWLAPGGRLVVVGHALRNLVDGVHGPRDPAHLQTEDGPARRRGRAGRRAARGGAAARRGRDRRRAAPGRPAPLTLRDRSDQSGVLIRRSSGGSMDDHQRDRMCAVAPSPQLRERLQGRGALGARRDRAAGGRPGLAAARAAPARLQRRGAAPAGHLRPRHRPHDRARRRARPGPDARQGPRAGGARRLLRQAVRRRHLPVRGAVLLDGRRCRRAA